MSKYGEFDTKTSHSKADVTKNNRADSFTSKLWNASGVYSFRDEQDETKAELKESDNMSYSVVRRDKLKCYSCFLPGSGRVNMTRRKGDGYIFEICVKAVKKVTPGFNVLVVSEMKHQMLKQVIMKRNNLKCDFFFIIINASPNVL